MNQNTPKIIEQYVEDTIQRDYLQAIGQPVPVEIAARISQTEQTARARLSPNQMAEAEQIVAVERMQRQGQMMAEHQAAQQRDMAERVDRKTQDLTAHRIGSPDGKGLTYDQFRQAQKTGKYTPKARKSALNLDTFKAAARERGISLEAFEKKLDDLVDHGKSGNLNDKLLKELDIDRDTVEAWGEHRISYGMERRRIDRGEYDEKVEDVEIDDEGDMRLDLLDSVAQHNDLGPDLDPRSLNDDGMHGDVARAAAQHME